MLDTRCFARSGRGTWFEEGETSLANTGMRRTADASRLYTREGVKAVAKKIKKRTGRVRPGNLAEDVATRLREGIRTGQYLAGEPLREADLARALGVSRVPVREALHRLVGEGLVELRPNLGARVAAISELELTELAELLRVLETHLLRRAIPALRPEDLQACERMLDELDGLDDLAEWSRVNWRFHTRLYRAAERPMAVGLASGLRMRGEVAMQLLIASPGRREGLNREHRELLACLRAGRAEEALALLDRHLSSSKDLVLDLVADGLPPRR